MTKSTRCAYCDNIHTQLHDVICPVGFNKEQLPYAKQTEKFFTMEISWSQKQYVPPPVEKFEAAVRKKDLSYTHTRSRLKGIELRGIIELEEIKKLNDWK